MKVPTLPHLVLLFFLGGVFLHFMLAGGRTFYSENLEKEPGALVGQLMFVFAGVIPVWWLVLYEPIHFINGVAGAALLLTSLALYEWARQTIWLRRFGLGWGDHVPEELCESGPYRRIRHPLYVAYMLASLAAFAALPHWITGAALALYLAVFSHAARNDEQRIAESPLAAAYAEYRQRVGMLFPRFN